MTLFSESQFSIPYGRQWLDEDDIRAVTKVLQSDWLTTGPKVQEFEKKVAQYVDAIHGIAVSSGTAALHSAMYAAGIGPGDEVILPPMTFAATANCVVFQGGTPVFADVDPETLLLDPKQVEEKISKKTKAILTVDYAGQPCEYDILQEISKKYNLILVDDACHALGAMYKKQMVGTLADMTVFSFHPVKHITTGEGGMITTDNEFYASGIRLFRNHGITTDHHQRALEGSWLYKMVELGFNYRIPDILCALGISQMDRLPCFLERRRAIAARYDEALKSLSGVSPLVQCKDRIHAYHLYVIRINKEETGIERSTVYHRLKARGIHTNVHYIPVHLHPYYRNRYHTGPGDCPVAEAAYEKILSLPIYPQMDDKDVNRVIDGLTEACRS